MPIQTPGDVLRTGRLTLKKTQREVADEIHKAYRTYQKWENDEARPSAFSDIISVCRACGVPVEDYILGQQGAPYMDQYDYRLLDMYRQLNEQDKQCVLRLTEGLVRLHEFKQDLPQTAEAPEMPEEAEQTK